ncbi:glycosyltransferase family 2 protein [Francisella sp. SYW-9]|uniref:glycosyltransferase family 2 protein n=1 Tax=Francisella sp. SYW-9 TaxID=2610888 RepID=UPI00123DA102|nr:glycosyltransferase family 2 protein [Francisella sp. SYW-9]
MENNKRKRGWLRLQNIQKQSQEKEPLITVITVVYNGENHLEETIQSVINQTYKHVEYIIIDGGSTDSTLDIIKKYESQVDYWISEPDGGIYDAMNKGISLANGDVIGLINSDDWYEVDTVEKVVHEYIASDKQTIFYGYLRIVPDSKKSFILNQSKNLKLLKKGMILDHPTIFVPKKIYIKYGLFSIDYKIVSDWDLMLRFYLLGVTFVQVKSILANFRLGGVSFTIDKNAIEEKHKVRKSYKLYRFIDKYYVYDLLKLVFFGKYVSKVSLIKQSFFRKLK